MAKPFTQRKIDGFVVENNVPIPEFQSSYTTWPFDKMEVGESFGLENADQVARCRSAATYAGQRKGWRFSIRKTPGEQTPYRCWRVE